MAENLTPKKYIDSNNMKQILTAIKSKTPVGGEYVTEEQLLAKDYADKAYVTEEIAKISTGGEIDLTSYLKKTEASETYVAKENGKGLSTNDFTTLEKEKLASLENYNDDAVMEHITNSEQAIADIQSYMGNATLTTTAQNISEAINEVKTNCDSATSALSEKVTLHEISEADYNALSEAERNNGDFYHVIDKNTTSDSAWIESTCPYVTDLFNNVVRNELLVSKDFISISLLLRDGAFNSYEWLTIAKTGIERKRPIRLVVYGEDTNATKKDSPVPLTASYETDGSIKVVNSDPPINLTELSLVAIIPRI